MKEKTKEGSKVVAEVRKGEGERRRKARNEEERGGRGGMIQGWREEGGGRGMKLEGGGCRLNSSAECRTRVDEIVDPEKRICLQNFVEK